jgi:hypothetical protein
MRNRPIMRPKDAVYEADGRDEGFLGYRISCTSFRV